MSTLAERRKLSPPQIASRLGVSHTKILAWIHSGELKAIDVSTARKEKPRYLVDIDDLEKFEQSRAVKAEA